ncbi:MAG: hypothetical protein P8078_08140 [bacterium]
MYGKDGMITLKDGQYQQLIDTIYDQGQQQVLQWWDQLDAGSRKKLLPLC